MVRWRTKRGHIRMIKKGLPEELMLDRMEREGKPGKSVPDWRAGCATALKPKTARSVSVTANRPRYLL